MAGRGTFGDDPLSLAGARNAVQAAGWPQTRSSPSWPICPIRLSILTAATPAAIEALFRAAPELRTRTTAVAVDENRFTRPGPCLVEAVAELNAILDRWEAEHRK